jgi:hypothetical protein
MILSEKITNRDFASLKNGAVNVPMGKKVDLAHLAGIPWGSAVEVSASVETASFVSGPASFQRSQWCLPVFERLEDSADASNWLLKRAERWRKEHGFLPLRSD